MTKSCGCIHIKKGISPRVIRICVCLRIYYFINKSIYSTFCAIWHIVSMRKCSCSLSVSLVDEHGGVLEVEVTQVQEYLTIFLCYLLQIIFSIFLLNLLKFVNKVMQTIFF